MSIYDDEWRRRDAQRIDEQIAQITAARASAPVTTWGPPQTGALVVVCRNCDGVIPRGFTFHACRVGQRESRVSILPSFWGWL